MGFEQQFSVSDIMSYVNDERERFEDVFIDECRIVGEQYIANARSNKTYQDRTGNLRSSVGYSIFKNGVLLEDNYPAGGVGSKAGRELAKWVAENHPSGIILVVTAGMHYSIYVESKGYDVITGSGDIASAEIKNRVNNLFEKLRKR